MNKLQAFFYEIGSLAEFSFRFFLYVFRPPYEFREIRKHMEELGVKTLPIVGVTGFIIGVVLTFQSYPFMAKFGAEAFMPYMVSVSVVRELGPVITALIFAGRVSSGIGAELGSMKVTEQIDAMDVSAIDPFNYLVVTRVIATTLILPILTVVVDTLALVGGFFADTLLQGTTLTLYLGDVFTILQFGDLIPGVGKTYIFGFIVGIVGAYKGYNASGGTEGVGRASTTAVVIASLLILVFDMILVKVTLWLWPVS